MTDSTDHSADGFDARVLQQYLGDRITSDHLERRLAKELYKGKLRRTEFVSWKRKLSSKRWILKQALRFSGLSGVGQRNALGIQLTHNTLPLPTLNTNLDGFKILHISDLHIDMQAGIGERIVALIKPLKPDLTLITGDFRDRSYGPPGDSLPLLKPIADVINSDCYGVLGNHDSLGLVPGLESMGINILLNESVSLTAHGIELTGVDDPSFFKCDDIDRAISGQTQSDALRILMVHAPNRIPQASQAGFQVYLCGHTHGGQICLPGERPIVGNVGKVEWRYCSGNWTYDSMLGYTSRGAGTSVVPARFNCSPEITLHQLRRV